MPLNNPCSGINEFKHSTHLIVHRDFDLYKTLKCHYDFDGNVAYSIIDSTNEPTNILWGFGDFYRTKHCCCCCHCIPHNIDLIFIDNEKVQIMNIIREKNRVAVYSPISLFIGSIIEKVCVTKFRCEMHILDDCGITIMKIPIKNKCSTIFSMNCEEIGIIQKVKRGKKIANFLIIVPKSLEIQKKALLVGAAIYMDQLWGKKNECPDNSSAKHKNRK